MRITQIDIKNFKAFYGEYTIDLTESGKNLLVYGENGSGKSSLFLAIKLFLGAAVEKHPFLDHRNIFVKEDPQQDFEGHIRLRLQESASSQVLTDEWSTSVYPSDQVIIETAKAKGFLDYKSLLETHFIHRHQAQVNLFDLLVEKILANTISDVTQKSLIEDWDKVQNSIPIRNTNKQIEKLQGHLNAFNQGVATKMTELQVKVTEILQKFGYPLEIQLNFDGVSYDKASKTITNRAILLGITFAKQPLSAPHHFLNEAKLSAIAIAIYLASLLIQPQTTLKILALDDILIGLDMNNRIPLLEILNQKFSDWQVFMTTYDRYWFEVAKRWFENKNKVNWEFFEMYVGEEQDFEVPVIISTESQLVKAEHYLAKHDYPACGMYLRKECESILSSLLKPAYRVKEVKQDEKTKNYETCEKNLNAWIVNLKDFCEVEQIDYSDFENLGIYKDALLNPLSHNDIQAPFFKTELEAIIEVLKKLEQIKLKEIDKTQGQDLILGLKKSLTGESYTVEFRPHEKICCLKEPNSKPRLIHFTKCERRSIRRNGNENSGRKEFDSLQELYKEACQDFGIPETDDLLEIITRRGQTLNELIKGQNLFS
jgi:AAA15 family ATPase/GTPase